VRPEDWIWAAAGELQVLAGHAKIKLRQCTCLCDLSELISHSRCDHHVAATSN
jgi:hypothetical protein